MIDILLASYNGERYIKQQILSIIYQTYQDWILIIHDDGSTDKTVNIIRSLENIDSRIRLVEDGVKCGSPAKNFIHLLNYSESEYAMFCDHDDIWFDNKVETMHNLISSQHIDKTIPCVAYSNAYVWHPDKGINGYASGIVVKDLHQFLFQNSGIQGCSSIFNRKMTETMRKYEGSCTMHDHLLQFLGCAFGQVLEIQVPLMLYRQHINNFTGGTAFDSSLLSRLISHRSIPVMTESHYYANLDMIRYYYNNLSVANKQLCDGYVKLEKRNIFYRLFYVIENKMTLGNSMSNLLLKIMIRPFLK